MKEIVLHAKLTEENRYDFTVQVDDNLSEAEQVQQAKEKLTAYLECNTPCVFYRGADEFEDILCYDGEMSVGGSVKELTKVYHDAD